MDLDQRIHAFAKLGDFLINHLNNDSSQRSPDDIHPEYYSDFKEILAHAKNENAWFTPEQVQLAIENWATILTKDALTSWLSEYDLSDVQHKKVAVVMAGNLPLVGFHDFLSVLITGHTLIAKLSSNDKLLLPFLTQVLIAIEPRFKDRIHFTQGKLPDFDAVIATGSDNTARYFEYYFKKHPHIIRKNRNGIAVLSGNESKEQLEKLGDDIFRFFGMGCRSISKLFVPVDYSFDDFFNAMFKHRNIIDHHKYANNYDYNKAVYLMSLFPVLDNNFMVLKEDEGLSSPISVVFYEFYEHTDALKAKLDSLKENIQCIVADGFSQNEIPFGQAQLPELSDYADGVDTIEFLLKL